MRPRPVLVEFAMIATLVTVGVLTAGSAGGQPAGGESYWGEHTLNGIFHTWPAVAIAVLSALVVGRLLGFYEMGAATMLLVLAAIAFLAYQFYWRPVPPVSSRSLRHTGIRQVLALGAPAGEPVLHARHGIATVGSGFGAEVSCLDARAFQSSEATVGGRAIAG